MLLSEDSHNAYGKRGFSEDGTPIVADAVWKAMLGKQYRKLRWQKVVEELAKAIKEITEVVEEIEKIRNDLKTGFRFRVRARQVPKLAWFRVPVEMSPEVTC